MKKKATKMDWIMHKATKPIHYANMVDKEDNVPKGAKFIIIDDKSKIIKIGRSIYFYFD